MHWASKWNENHPPEWKQLQDLGVCWCCVHCRYTYKQKPSLLSVLVLSPEESIRHHQPFQVVLLLTQRPCHSWGFPLHFPLTPTHKGDPFQLLLAAPLSAFSSSDSLPWGWDWWKEENKYARWMLGERLGLWQTGGHFKQSPPRLSVFFGKALWGWQSTDTSDWRDPDACF